MRVFMLLNFYEESASWLAASIASTKGLVDHVVAIDGRYALFPDGEPQSRSDQPTTIVELAQSCGMGLTLHRQNHLWFGNEVEKRTHLFKLALLDATEDDWLFVLDADEVVTSCPGETRQMLEQTDLDVASITAFTRTDINDNPKKAEAARQFEWRQKSEMPVRKFFRALPGLHCQGNHYTYTTGDGRKLWGNTTYEGHDVVPCLEIPGFRVEHRTEFRDVARKNAAQDYYRRRDKARVEAAYICHKCRGEFPEMRTYPTDFKVVEGELTFGSVEACPGCGEELVKRNIARLNYLGVDPNVGMAGAVKALLAVNA